MTSQTAREAAEDAYLTCFEDVPNPAWMEALIAGKHDNDPVVQAFARIEAEALARGRMEGAKAMKEAAAEEVEGYPSMDGADIPIVRGCAFAVRALDPAAIVKGLNDADQGCA